MSLASADSLDLVPELPWSCQTGFVSDLLLRCGHGDEAAFGRLFDLCYPIVAGALISAAADRTVVDAFVAVWSNAPGFRAGEVSAVQWILEVALERDSAAPARSGYGAPTKTTTLLL